MQIELNKKNDNPFFGMTNCLKLTDTNRVPTESNLDEAWNEVKDNKEKREMFFSVLFSIGDITNRQHNIFKGKKVDSGGGSNRDVFFHIAQWMWKNHREQFVKFLNVGLFNEYTCFDTLLRNRVQTKGARVLKVESVLADKEYRKVMLDYMYAVINGSNPFNKMLIAKFLTIPRTSKRQGHKKMLDETKQVMLVKAQFIEDLSKLMGWEIKFFKGYREWRKQYNGELESVLFTTGKIREFNKTEFLDWFDKLPAQARFRVKNRILYSENKGDENNANLTPLYKWAEFQPWIKEWEKLKEEKQLEQRILEEKVRQGQATDEDKLKLKEVKKAAKVTVGATNFNDLYNDIIYNRADKLKLESFMNRVNLPYNSLVIIDDSGSMSGKPFNMAKFIASVCLVKNPDDDARNLIGFFGSHSHWHSFIDKTSGRRNSILRNVVAQTNVKPLVDGTLSFYENYQRISNFCDAVYQGGGTYLRKVPEELEFIIKENPEMLDELKKYPIWTIISDGDLNSSYNARSSMLDFQVACKRILGYCPFLVVIEIYNYGNPGAIAFEGLENFIYINNPAQIEQFLVNFKDIDIMDVYTPLLSLYRSNRYLPVRENTI